MLKPKDVYTFAAFLLLLYMLFFPPIYGMGDDGTFYAALKSNGLYFLDGSNSAYVSQKYGIMRGDHAAAEGSVPIQLAVMLNKLFYSKTVFDIRFLAAIYSALLLFALYLALRTLKFRTPWVNWACGALCVLIFADLGYIAYFNSFCYEASAFVYFAIAVAAALNIATCEKPSVFFAIVYFLASLLYAYTAKQAFFAALLLAALLLRFAFAKRDNLWRALSFVLSIMLFAGSIAAYTNLGIRNRDVNIYQSVFYGILKSSPDPAGDLKKLGLSGEYAYLAGTTYYDAVVAPETMKEGFFDRITYSKIALFYFKNPLRLAQMLKNAGQNAFFLKQDYLKYTVEGASYRLKIPLSIWSFVKRVLPIQHILLLLAFIAAFVVISIRSCKQKPFLRDTLLLLGASAVVWLFVPIIVSGSGSISKNLFMFGAIFDMMLIIAAGWAAQTLIDRQEEIRRKYGVTQ